MPITVILGEQRGDEGKGRFTDMLMPDYDIGARFNGGDNAGHTVVAPDGEVYKLHGLPTSVVHPHAKSVIGNGTVVNPVRLIDEIQSLSEQGIEIDEGNLLISGGSQFILPSYISADTRRENGPEAQGSTKSGIAQAYAAKMMRIGLRADTIKHQPEELAIAVRGRLADERKWLGKVAGSQENNDAEKTAEFMDYARWLGKYITDTAYFLDTQLAKARPARILAEGAQAFLLDIDHGMYPYVSSSTTTIGGVSSGLGIAAQDHIEKVVGVSKAIPSHVGGGPFVTEIHEPGLLKRMHGDMTAVDAEKGTTTGRVRRLGHYDIPVIRRSHMVNGTNEMALTKLDWVPRYGSEVQICTGYLRNGKVLPVSVDSAYKMEQETVPVYESLPTWTDDITSIRRFEDLPEEAKQYIRFIEDKARKAITLVGVGPQVDQVIDRREDLRK